MSRWHLHVVGCGVVLIAAAPAFAQRQAAPEAPAGGGGGAIETAPASPDSSPPPSVPLPPSPAPPADQPFRRLLPNLWDDLRRLPSVGTGLVLGAGGVMSAVASKNDDYFTTHAAAGGTDQIFQAGGGLGAGYAQVGIAVGTYAIGRMTGHAAFTHLGADLIRGQLLTGVLTHGIKAVTRRTRPTGDQESSTDTYSFPSAHASATWTTSTVLWRHLGWKVGVPASMIAAYVSASRLQQNAHYMSDVLFGAALGIASARTVTVSHGERRIAVSAVPVAGGAAVTFAVVPH